MDCRTARLLAELRGNRDSELPGEDAAALDRHLQACPDCQLARNREALLDAPLLKAMNDVAVPTDLKARIFNRMAIERGAVLRRRIFVGTASVAALLLAVGLIGWKPDRRAKFDVGELVAITDQYVEDPGVAADRWLASQGVRYQPPKPYEHKGTFDPRLLAFHGTVTFMDKQVPMLCYRVFENGVSVSAKVYLIRSSDFDFSTVPQRLPEGGSWGERGHQVKILPDAEQPDKLVYVVVYNSQFLDPFLIPIRQS